MLFEGMTTAEQLQSVKAAIKAIEEGVQSYRMGDETVSMADLSALYKREKDLRIRLSRRKRRQKTFLNVNFPSGE